MPRKVFLYILYEGIMKTNLNCHRQAYTENLSEAKECPTCVRALGKGSKPGIFWSFSPNKHCFWAKKLMEKK